MRLVLRLLVLLQQRTAIAQPHLAVLVTDRVFFVHREIRRENITRRAWGRFRQPVPGASREDISGLRPFVQRHVQRFGLAPVEVALGFLLIAFGDQALLLGQLLDFVQQLAHFHRGAGGPWRRVWRSQIGKAAYVRARHAVGHAVRLLNVRDPRWYVRGSAGNAHRQVEKIGEVVLLFLTLGINAAVFG